MINLRWNLLICILFLTITGCGTESGKEQTQLDTSAVQSQQLAETILSDQSLTDVFNRAEEIVRTGFNAGDGYGQVWIRDFATFIETSCDVYDKAEIRENLLTFFKFQGEDGNIIDGFAPKDKAHGGDPNLITTELAPGFYAHKNTVETDQESSLIQAIHIFVEKTGDTEFLSEEVAGRTVLDRMEFALEFLMNERYNEQYGLIWGATTADWGDVQPEDGWGVDMNENTRRAIDIYDNAMFIIAMSNYMSFPGVTAENAAKWRKIHDEVKANVREHLWDDANMKFIPHIYLNGSPFPKDFDESEVYYHGGTAVAILAGLLTQDEIKFSIDTMVANVKESGAGSIGLTVYPPYREGLFQKGMGPYLYQNGGDWTWFGGRMISALIVNGFIEEAYRELKHMTDRVIVNDGFYEWYSVKNEPRGSGTFRGSAGVLASAITLLREWAEGQ